MQQSTVELTQQAALMLLASKPKSDANTNITHSPQMDLEAPKPGLASRRSSVRLGKKSSSTSLPIILTLFNDHEADIVAPHPSPLHTTSFASTPVQPPCTPVTATGLLFYNQGSTLLNSSSLHVFTPGSWTPNLIRYGVTQAQEPAFLLELQQLSCQGLHWHRWTLPFENAPESNTMTHDVVYVVERPEQSQFLDAFMRLLQPGSILTQHSVWMELR